MPTFIVPTKDMKQIDHDWVEAKNMGNSVFVKRLGKLLVWIDNQGYNRKGKIVHTTRVATQTYIVTDSPLPGTISIDDIFPDKPWE